MGVLEFLRSFNHITVFIRILLACLAGGILGAERGKHGRVAGMRTHILVCTGSALTIMIGIFTVGTLGFGSDATRIAAQTISGIGFLGVGTIMVRGKSQVVGLTTAAGLWAAAAIGLSFGAGFYVGGVLGTMIAILVNMLLPKIEYRYKLSRVSYVFYVEIASVYEVQAFVDSIEKSYPIQEVEITTPNSGHSSHVGINIIVFARQTQLSEEQILADLSAREETVFAIKTV
ncbi:MAG: MgtC/SapB family protein [Clostridia bacterium]|nr:MgtC/SapB family protein [Clostridia bacterium]